MIVSAVEYREITLRRAALADCERVWQWNFATDVRAQSKDPRAVSLEQHTAWFRDRIVEPGSPMWVVCEGGAPLGVIRIDRRARDLARMSIALAPTVRGRGIGRRAIAAACHMWGQPVIAEISATNTPSRLCFEACGFRQVAERDALLTYHWSP